MAISGDNHWSSESRWQHWSEYELHGECLIKSRIYSSFASTWIQPRFLWVRVTHHLSFLCCVFCCFFFFNWSSFCVLWPNLFVSLECPFLIVPFTIPWRLFIVSSTPHQATLAVSGTKSTGKCIYNWHAIAVNLFLVNKWYEWHLVVLNVA
jgi:hypothetical protein